MNPTKRTVPLIALAAPAAWLLAVLQADVTNQSGFAASIVQDYADGTIGDHWTDGVPPIIWQARVLVRGLILAMVNVAPGLEASTANLIIQAGFVAAALVVVYRTTMKLATQETALFAAALAVAFVPWGFLSVGYRVSYPYDLPALFFSAAGLAAIVSRRFAWLVVAVAIGTLNKETTIFLLPAYVFAEWRTTERRQLLVRGAVLAGAFVAAYAIPRYLLQSAHPMIVTVEANVGDGGTRLWANLDHLFGEPGGFVESVWWVALLHVPPLLFWRRLPRPLRAAYLATPFFVVPMFFFANVFELRLYNELIPLGAMSCAAALAAAPDAEAAPPPRARPSGRRR